MSSKSTISKVFLLLAVFVLIAISAGSSARAQEPPYLRYLPSIASIKIDAPRWLGPEGGTVYALAADPSNQNILYAGTAATGVFKTTNNGASWVAANKGIENLTVVSLAIDPDDPENVYAGTDGQGIYRSTDGGATWTSANEDIDANAIVYALVVNPGNTTLVYAGTRTKGTNNGILYKSVDNGKNWAKVFSQTGNWVNSLAVNPSKPNVILAATQTKGPYIAKSYGNAGEWTATTVNDGDRNSGMAVAFDPRGTENRAFFSAWNDDFFVSSNGGDTWDLSDSGVGGDSTLSRNGLAVKPSSPNILFLATNSSSTAGVLRSINSGDSWTASGLKGKKVYAIAVPPGDANTIFAGTLQEGVYKSSDGGVTWRRSTSGLGSSHVTGMAFRGKTTYYSATYGGGVFRSTNSGQSWVEFNTNLGDLYINGLVQHPTQPNILFALTANAGLRRIDLNTTGGWTASEGLPEAFERENYAMLDDPETTEATTAVGTNGMAFAPSNPNIAYLATNGGGVYASTNSGATFVPKGLANEVIKGVTVHRTNPNIVYVATSTNGIVKKSTDGGTAWTNMALPAAQSTQPVNAVAMWPDEADRVCAGTNNGVWSFNGSSWEAAGLQGYKVTSLTADPYNQRGMIAGTDKGAFYSTDHKTWTPIAKEMGAPNIASISFNPAEPLPVYLGTVSQGALRYVFTR